MRLLGLSAALLALTASAADPKADAAKAKKGLQDLGEFVGTWNLTADTKTGGKLVSWKETAAWSWKFKGDDAWLAVEAKGAKHFPAGELRYKPDAKAYELKAVGPDKKERVYAGEFKKGKLTLTRADEGTKDVHKFTVNTLADGVRMAVVYEVQKGGAGPFEAGYKAAGNKDGEALAGGGGAKKPDCVVTGGTATISVSHKGVTYYVCCSGCKEEFEANPEKYVAAAKKK